MKCRRCGTKAVIDLKSHNTAFCRDCFFEFFERQVKRAIKEHRMFKRSERVLVCVSGGKDSLALWEVLGDLGYRADGLYIDLGIEGYSSRSKEKVQAYASLRRRRLHMVSIQEMGIRLDEVARSHRRNECSVCGVVKRHLFNRVAVEGGYDAVATGHNLDDEAGRLLGNLLRWQWEYLVKQGPVLPAVGGMLKKKVEPLCRVTERETAAFVILKGIDYVLEECPYSRGATSLRYKEVLNLIEDWMPGTKMNFMGGFLRHRETFERAAPVQALQDEGATRCSSCGYPSFMDPCSFCRFARGKRPEVVTSG